MQSLTTFSEKYSILYTYSVGDKASEATHEPPVLLYLSGFPG